MAKMISAKLGQGDDRSETARRLTNLFLAPSPITIDGRFYEEYLLHRTARGEIVRAKSEVIIADHLSNKGVGVWLRAAAHSRRRDEVSRLGRELLLRALRHAPCPQLQPPLGEKLSWYKAHGILPA